MELNRDQIIKALECCVSIGAEDCKECAYRKRKDSLYAGCVNALTQDALALIKELTQRLEMLSESYDHLEKTKDELLAERSRLIEENERVKLEYAGFEAGARHAVSFARADTVRKMQERLKANKVCRDGLSFKVVDFDTIDQITKEILEE